MATRIRLRRIGRKKLPLYRIVVADQEAPRDGRFIEIIGNYNPKGETTAEKVQVDAEKARQWIAKGATPSQTVESLLKQAGVFQTAGTTTTAKA
jgi:small subunit ribosomal protein S16